MNKQASEIMTPRETIVWIDIYSDFEGLKKAVLKNQYWYYPVCKDTLDNVVGIINSDALLATFIVAEKIKIQEFMSKPLFIQADMKALDIMRLFKKEHIHMAVVKDEAGTVKGLVTVTDILDAIVDGFPNDTSI